MWNCKVKRNGYTLLEILLVLLIVLTMTFTFPLLFTIFSHWIKQPGSLHPFEWEVAMTQLAMDVREASELEIVNGSLNLLGSETIMYEPYGQILRRRVNNAGHEVILQNIKTVQFDYVQSGIKIKVTGIDGVGYEKTIYRWVQ